MTELEYIGLSFSLVIIVLLSIYFGVKLLEKLMPMRRNIPDSKNYVSQEQCSQKADNETRGEGVQLRPLHISPDNPNNNTYKSNDKNSIPYPLGYLIVAHIISIVKRFATKCKRYLDNAKSILFT